MHWVCLQNHPPAGQGWTTAAQMFAWREATMPIEKYAAWIRQLYWLQRISKRMLDAGCSTQAWAIVDALATDAEVQLTVAAKYQGLTGGGQ